MAESAVAEVTETKVATPVETNADEVTDDKEAPKTEQTTTTEADDELHLGQFREKTEETNDGKVEYKNLVTGETSRLTPEEKADAIVRDRDTLSQRQDRLNKVKSERTTRWNSIESRLKEAGHEDDFIKAARDDYNAAHLTAREAFEAEQLEQNALAFNIALKDSSPEFWKQITAKAGDGGVVGLEEGLAIAAELLAPNSEYVKKLSIEDYAKTPTGKKELAEFKEHWFEEGKKWQREAPPGDPKVTSEGAANSAASDAERLANPDTPIPELMEIRARMRAGG